MMKQVPVEAEAVIFRITISQGFSKFFYGILAALWKTESQLLKARRPFLRL
jgi:hypothetical protein